MSPRRLRHPCAIVFPSPEHGGPPGPPAPDIRHPCRVREARSFRGDIPSVEGKINRTFSGHYGPFGSGAGGAGATGPGPNPAWAPPRASPSGSLWDASSRGSGNAGSAGMYCGVCSRYRELGRVIPAIQVWHPVKPSPSPAAMHASQRRLCCISISPGRAARFVTRVHRLATRPGTRDDRWTLTLVSVSPVVRFNEIPPNPANSRAPAVFARAD